MKTIKIKYFIFAIASMMVLFGCDEAKRFEISESDVEAPDAPEFISSKPLPGGARVFFKRPSNPDLLAVEAAYINTFGERVWFLASFFTDSLDVLGFHYEGEYDISLTAVDRAGNHSTPVIAKVTALEPAVQMVARSVRLLPSFSAIVVEWEDFLKQNLFVQVDVAYTQNGSKNNTTYVFNTSTTESRSIDLDLFNGETVSVNVTVKDRYGNYALVEEATLDLLSDEKLSKKGWTIPEPGFTLGGITQADGTYGGGTMEAVIDGLTEEDITPNYFYTTENNWNIIIDLGEKYELSRILTHQRYSYMTYEEGSVRGAFYRADNVLSYDMYVWDEDNQVWDPIPRRIVPVPVPRQDSEWLTFGFAGDMTFLYPSEPKFTKPTRYFRFRAISGKYISEISLYGKAKN